MCGSELDLLWFCIHRAVGAACRGLERLGKDRTTGVYQCEKLCLFRVETETESSFFRHAGVKLRTT